MINSRYKVFERYRIRSIDWMIMRLSYQDFPMCKNLFLNDF